MNEFSAVWQDESMRIIFNAMVQSGRFSGNDMVCYSKMIEAQYFGDPEDRLGKVARKEVQYFAVMGLTYHEFRALRARLRKIDLMVYVPGKKQWILRDPACWLQDHTEVAVERPVRVKVRQAAIESAQQMELAIA